MPFFALWMLNFCAPVLTMVTEGDAIEIVGDRGEWVEVRFDKPVPVYFRKPPASATRQAAREQPVEVPATAETPPPAAEADGQEEAPEEAVVVAPPQRAQAQPPRQPEPPAGTPMRSLAGTLVRERGSADGPRFTLSLRRDGRRLAYVDISRLFIRDLRPYLDEEVIVMGEVSSISPGGTQLVIHARTLRTRP